MTRRTHVITKADPVAKSRDESHTQRQKRLWEQTFNSVLDLIAILDCDHRILQVNQAMADRLGRTPQQCVGLTCYETIHGLSQPPSFCPHALTLIDNQPHAAEVREDRLGGDFLVTTTPLQDEFGQIIGSVHVAHDITEQKKAHDSLKHMLESSDHERHLIGFEIHDGLAQQLAAALIQFEAFECLKEESPEQAAKAHALCLQLIREAHAEVRRLIGELRPPQLEEGGIVPAIENFVRDINKQKKVRIEFYSKLDQLDLEPMLEDTVFRIVQECITNACRHSKSKKVKVEITQQGGQLRVEVQDWGVGFKVDRVREGHFGLEGIQERAKVFGGRVNIRSVPRKGTDIVVELPVRSPRMLHPESSPTTPPQRDKGGHVRRPK
jgi:PAS domain S-box-containing protein